MIHDDRNHAWAWLDTRPVQIWAGQNLLATRCNGSSAGLARTVLRGSDTSHHCVSTGRVVILVPFFLPISLDHSPATSCATEYKLILIKHVVKLFIQPFLAAVAVVYVRPLFCIPRMRNILPRRIWLLQVILLDQQLDIRTAGGSMRIELVPGSLICSNG